MLVLRENVPVTRKRAHVSHQQVHTRQQALHVSHQQVHARARRVPHVSHQQVHLRFPPAHQSSHHTPTQARPAGRSTGRQQASSSATSRSAPPAIRPGPSGQGPSCQNDRVGTIRSGTIRSGTIGSEQSGRGPSGQGPSCQNDRVGDHQVRDHSGRGPFRSRTIQVGDRSGRRPFRSETIQVGEHRPSGLRTRVRPAGQRAHVVVEGMNDAQGGYRDCRVFCPSSDGNRHAVFRNGSPDLVRSRRRPPRSCATRSPSHRRIPFTNPRTFCRGDRCNAPIYLPCRRLVRPHDTSARTRSYTFVQTGIPCLHPHHRVSPRSR